MHDYFTDPVLAQELGAFAKFQLLKKAYIDARYKKEYTITTDELQYLAERVQLLGELTEKLCQEEIAHLKR